MGTLVDSNRDPNLFESPIDHKKARDDGSKAYRKMLDESYTKWKKFGETDPGKVVADLADPMIAHCDYVQGMSLTDMKSIFGYIPSLEQANELRAEYRGRRYVWVMVKSQPDVLKRLLEEIEGFDPDKKEKTGWQKMTKDMKKKLTGSE